MILNRYDEFLIESLLKESIVVFSEEFKNILSKIDSPIAKAFLDIESKDLDVPSNYLDVRDRETISFITDSKQKQILKSNKNKFTIVGNRFLRHSDSNKEIFDLLGYIPQGESTYMADSNEIGEIVKEIKSPSSENIYVLIRFENGKETVINKESIRPVKDDLFNNKSRQSIRTGRAVTTILSKLGQKFKDNEVEEFVNKYKATYDIENDIFKNFKIVSGEDIKFWYLEDNYYDSSGPLGSSCMRYDSCQDYFDIYVENENCSLLILKKDEDRISGRALVWKTEKPVGITFMDRIYTNSDSDVELFKQYAHSKGWYHKSDQNMSDVFNLVGKDEILPNPAVVVDISNYYQNIENFPYVDSVKYLTDDGKLTNRKERDARLLEDTDGNTSPVCEGCDGSGRVTCSECDGDETVRCSNCRGRGTTRCETCVGDAVLDCPKCNGYAEIKCPTCDGKGCGNCSESGKIDCQDCSNGRIDCEDCSNGRVSCEECDGSGEVTCGNCENGDVDCPECN